MPHNYMSLKSINNFCLRDGKASSFRIGIYERVVAGLRVMIILLIDLNVTISRFPVPTDCGMIQKR